ncbi:hypothetical protein COCOBI_04-6390 [Coccomyxa sp. Obi]|nr:hypothetical protein COCOBI_04-6390 [Coccomyxa sp. Obi]
MIDGDGERQVPKYIGVCWKNKVQKYRAYVNTGTGRKVVGYYSDSRSAAIAREKALIATKLGGWRNFDRCGPFSHDNVESEDKQRSKSDHAAPYWGGSCTQQGAPEVAPSVIMPVGPGIQVMISHALMANPTVLAAIGGSLVGACLMLQHAALNARPLDDMVPEIPEETVLRPPTP